MALRVVWRRWQRLVAFLGAVHYWWPKFTGRMYSESLGRVCSLGVFFGFNLTFLPQFCHANSSEQSPRARGQ